MQGSSRYLFGMLCIAYAFSFDEAHVRSLLIINACYIYLVMRNSCYHISEFPSTFFELVFGTVVHKSNGTVTT